MAEQIAIVGDSGQGKTRSIVGLDPKETFIISVSGKALPFQGWKKNYIAIDEKCETGNYYSSRDASEIVGLLKAIDKNRPDIKNVIIDDYQYIMGFEFFERADEKGYEKFASIGKNGALPVIEASKLKRDDLKVIILTHDEMVQENFKPKRKIKTIGKMVDEKLTMEGLFTVVLFSNVQKGDDGKITYGFITNSDGTTTAKSPEGMFDKDIIPNDLGLVVSAIDKYYGEG